MDGLLLFTFTASIAVSCMALALAIASHILHRTTWSAKYIVLQSCLIGILVVFLASKLSLFFMPGHVYTVFSFIFNTIVIASMGFVLTLLPYFLSWVIASPWEKIHRAVFFPAGIIYYAVGFAALIVKNDLFDFWSEIGRGALALGVFVYCIVILWVNLKNIEDKAVRHICLAINIVALSLIPLAILSLFFKRVEEFSYPIYILAFSIVIMVYNYIRFGLFKEKEESKPVLSFESLSQYKISEREFTVVQLICEGYTNKEIAQELSISVNTVNNHVANIFSKMGVRSRIDLLKALKEGPWS